MTAVKTRAVALAALVVVAVVAVVAESFLSPQDAPPQQRMVGSLFVSDAGRSHGGFEYTAQWNATLTLSGSDGTLTMNLSTGLGDALTTHDFSVTRFSRNATTVSMLLDGKSLVMEWVSADRVWNGTYDRYYISSWGSDAPPNELIGRISPAMFPGLVSSWYVELRLK